MSLMGIKSIPRQTICYHPQISLQRKKRISLFAFQAVTLFAVLLSLSLILDLTNSFWIARSRLGRGRGGRFSRFGRSDPDMIDGIVAYLDNPFPILNLTTNFIHLYSKLTSNMIYVHRQSLNQDIFAWSWEAYNFADKIWYKSLGGSVDR